MDENNKGGAKKSGRKPKVDPAIIRYSISLTADENKRFLALYQDSGLKVKAHFITACIFQKTIKTVKIDKSIIDYHIQLAQFYGQFRAIGVNYNQIVKLLYRNFSEKKAAAYLYKLEKQTIEMTKLIRLFIELTQNFEENYIKKNLEK